MALAPIVLRLTSGRAKKPADEDCKSESLKEAGELNPGRLAASNVSDNILRTTGQVSLTCWAMMGRNGSSLPHLVHISSLLFKKCELASQECRSQLVCMAMFDLFCEPKYKH